MSLPWEEVYLSIASLCLCCVYAYVCGYVLLQMKLKPMASMAMVPKAPTSSPHHDSWERSLSLHAFIPLCLSCLLFVYCVSRWPVTSMASEPNSPPLPSPFGCPPYRIPFMKISEEDDDKSDSFSFSRDLWPMAMEPLCGRAKGCLYRGSCHQIAKQTKRSKRSRIGAMQEMPYLHMQSTQETP